MADTGTNSAAAAAPTIDVDRIRARYREERDRRLRADANAQYVRTEGRFAAYLDDPWADPDFSRAPVHDEIDVLIVGGGFGGLLAGARLKMAGVESFRIIDKAADFGGTWYWNRYPGAACDTESYIYLPLLEETGYMPERKYAPAPEIMEHSRRIGRHFGLYEGALFQTVITGMRWIDDDQRWAVSTSRDDDIRARFVILAGGPLQRPKLPGIEGIESFRGHSFHTSRWDYDYTGGSSRGGLTGLKDKRVGIIGTGATAIQCVPHLGEWAKELFVFQRTPSTVDVRADRPTDPDWAKSLAPGWQRERMDNFTSVISGGPFDVDLVNDGWTDLIGNILLAARRQAKDGAPPADPEALVQMADFQKMERVRARVDAIVRDSATAEALKPWYNAFCKRPCFHDAYLQTFNRPNVHLVDTKGRGIDRVVPGGVVVDGKTYEIDCLIYSTGFEVGEDYTRQIGFEIHGRDGQTLTEKWKDGARTLHGFFSRGFPNCFIVSTLQTGQSANFQHMLDERSKHFAHIISRLRELGVTSFEPTEQAETEWVEKVVKAAKGRETYLRECTPGYYNNEGAGFDERLSRNSQYWRGPVAFLKMLDKWRAEGSFAGLELRR
ncbi:MAG: NAD(P)/FAD-dependent oxidoreductase [Pseudomonadota bacterium]|nr:NAD(P)/FAD-dependent oxidoreductase [Pseudomonadota bacterium]